MTPRPAPYPADTSAKGWRFELDYEQIDQSDTWDIAGEIPMCQPALLMMWLAAWRQKPCGSLPADEAVIRVKCKLTADVWEKCRSVLLRGWWLAEDGRLYHDTIVTRVLVMLEKRAKDAKRTADSRARKGDTRPRRVDVTCDTHVTNEEPTCEFDTKHQAPSTNTSVPIGTGVADARPSKVADPSEIIFGYGVPLLTTAGTAERQARSFLGKLRKDHGDEAVISKLRDCIKSKPLQPLEWLAAALPPAGARASPPGGLSAAGAATLQATQSLEAKLFGEVHEAS